MARNQLFADIKAAAKISSLPDQSAVGRGRILSSPREDRLEVDPFEGVDLSNVVVYFVDPDIGEGIDLPIDIRSECGD